MTAASPDHAGASAPERLPWADQQAQFRQLDGASEMAAAAALIAEVFGAAEGPPLPVDLLTAISCAGGFVGAALMGGDVIGVAVAFGEVPPPLSAGGGQEPVGLHSHVAAVHPAARGLRIGQRLKWFQREWALQRGIGVIHWTFDPLVRRNAVLNLNRLGAVGVAYHRNLYGAIPDALNAGMESDRLLVRWELTGPRVQAAQAGLVPGTAVGTESASDGTVTAAVGTPHQPAGTPDRSAPEPSAVEPTAAERSAPAASALRASTPEDIEGLLARDPGAAREWRRRQRAELEPPLRQGYLVTGITPDGRYWLEHP
jgi:predicted GNAT superfamily acetyltransferase